MLFFLAKTTPPTAPPKAAMMAPAMAPPLRPPVSGSIHLQVASSHRPHLPFFMLPSKLVEVAHHLKFSSVLSSESDGKRRSFVHLVYSLSLNLKGNLHCLTSAAQPVVAV